MTTWMKIFVFSGILLHGLIVSAAFAAPPSPSAQDLIKKCEAAFDAVQSYSCHIDVVTSNLVPDRHASADIWFVRPGKIKANISSGFAPSASMGYVSDGRQTGLLMMTQWVSESSTEMAIAGVTGVGMLSATTIPALLLHSNWGYPFLAGYKINPFVSISRVLGESCYRVEVDGKSKAVFWIDAKTYLLDKVQETSSGLSTFTITQVITEQKVDSTIDPSTFNVPNATVPKGTGMSF
jgi:outer membrane lipoprotein-sorting protein